MCLSDDEQCMWSLFLVIYFNDLFAKIHHYFSTVIGAIMWVHTDSEVVLEDIDKKQQHKPSWNTTNHKTIVRFLGYTDPNCCEWWQVNSLNYVQMPINMHTHPYTHTYMYIYACMHAHKPSCALFTNIDEHQSKHGQVIHPLQSVG